LLASLSAWHIVVELKVAVELNINLHVSDGESVDALAGAAREAWGAALVA
jgi:hypothetical protein